MLSSKVKFKEKNKIVFPEEVTSICRLIYHCTFSGEGNSFDS